VAHYPTNAAKGLEVAPVHQLSELPAAAAASRAQPAIRQYVNSDWNSSRTKIIDNAIVGLISDQKGAEKKTLLAGQQQT